VFLAFDWPTSGTKLRAPPPDGALFGGVIEYNSMYFGFAFLYLLAWVFSLKPGPVFQPAE
jgi:hypothetical protein